MSYVKWNYIRKWNDNILSAAILSYISHILWMCTIMPCVVSYIVTFCVRQIVLRNPIFAEENTYNVCVCVSVFLF